MLAVVVVEDGTVVIAANGYPESYEKGTEIRNLAAAEAVKKELDAKLADALGQIDQAVWNSSRGRFLEQTDNGYIATRLTDHVEPILVLISMAVFGFNLFGEGLRDAFDPKD